jgi:O-antigen/teichoic acid export membrane protein
MNAEIVTPDAKSTRRRVWEAAGATLMSRGVRIVEQIALIPIFLVAWGVGSYGEWLTLTAVAALASVSNFGLGSAAGNEVVMRLGAGDREGAQKICTTALVLLSGLLLIVAALVVAALTVIDVRSTAHLAHFTRAQASVVLMLVTLNVMIGFMTGPLNSTLGAMVGVGAPNMIGAVSKLAEIAATILALLFKADYLVVAWIMVGFGALTVVANVIAIKRVSPWFQFRPSLFDRSMAGLVLKPAASIFVLYVAVNAIGVQVPRMVLFSLLGPAAVVVFTVSMTYARTVRSFAAVVMLSTGVELGRAFGSKDTEKYYAMVTRACQSAFWVAIVLALGALAVSPLVIEKWTAGRVHPDYGILVCLLLGAVMASFSDVLANAMIVTNRLWPIALGALVGFTVAIGLGALLLPVVGAVGMAMALLIPESAMIVVSYLNLSRHAPSNTRITPLQLIAWPGAWVAAEVQVVRDQASKIAARFARRA